MEQIEVQVQPDHLTRLFATVAPHAALTELLWNALDADATEVRVESRPNSLGGWQSLLVSDNGHGIDHRDVRDAFTNLGGSRKAARALTPKGRAQHGQLGKGRFRAFALGNAITWDTRYSTASGLVEYSISSTRQNPKLFAISDTAPSLEEHPGTTVAIDDPLPTTEALDSDRTRARLTEEFAIYLRQYADVTIEVFGKPLNPSSLQTLEKSYPIGPITTPDKRVLDGTLTVIEWAHSPERALFLCDETGLVLAKQSPGVQAPGYSFTAYLRSTFIEEAHRVGNLVLEDLDPNLRLLTEAAKQRLKEHFRARSAEDAQHAIARWKRDDLYPFSGEPIGVLEETERQIFDVVALNVEAALPSPEEINPKHKRLAFRLIREALERSPSSLHRILDEVLGLPADRREDLAHLLEHTTLDRIISASRLVGDRLDFLNGLETLVFDPESKKTLKERTQLHKILSTETWIFGEQFGLSVSDRGLTEVLRKHLQRTHRDILDERPVANIDGGRGIVDLMLSRTIPQTNPDNHEHLVVELKRPSEKLGSDAITQAEQYAFAISSDERFKDSNTRWAFWVVSNDYDEYANQRSRAQGRPPGLIHVSEDGQIQIWIKTWGSLISEARGRLRFFQDRLGYSSGEEDGIAYIRRTHAKYLPPSLLETNPPADV